MLSEYLTPADAIREPATTGARDQIHDGERACHQPHGHWSQMKHVTKEHREHGHDGNF
jgi:hypothetical protein